MKIFKLLNKVIEIVCAVLMIIMTVVTFAQVIRRYIFNDAFYWSEQLVILSMLWLAFLGSTIGISRDQHTKIDFFINLFSSKIKGFIEIVGDIICAVIAGILAYASLDVLEATKGQTSVELGVSRGIYTYAIIVGGSLMVLFFILSAIKRFKTNNSFKGGV